MTTPPTSMPTAAARLSPRLQILHPAPESNCAMSTSQNRVWRIYFFTTPEGVCAIELEDFFALLARDAHVARRNFIQLVLQTFLQPMMFVFIFGRVMVSSGYMPPAYKSLLLPGIMAISMVFTGVWAVAMPLIAEFQFTREIEDRLLAPIEIYWLAIESNFWRLPGADRWSRGDSGRLAPAAAGRGLEPAFAAYFRLCYAAGLAFLRLRWSCSRLQRQPNSHRTDVQHGAHAHDLFGCTYYPWSALGHFPILQKIVLVNPLVYASEGLRATLVPQFPHLSLLAVLVALTCFDALFLGVGLKQFHRKAVS